MFCKNKRLPVLYIFHRTKKIVKEIGISRQKKRNQFYVLSNNNLEE